MGKYIFDQYTLLHFAVGIIFYFWNISFSKSILLHTLFEIVENTLVGMNLINNYFTIWPGGKPFADSNINILGDTFGFSMGWYLAYYVDNLGEKYGFYKKHIVN
jgi:hypothetical protein